MLHLPRGVSQSPTEGEEMDCVCECMTLLKPENLIWTMMIS